MSACARGDQTAGPAASIEQLELNAGRVDRATHQAAERVDLPHEMALRGAADCRIARHVRDRVGRQRADADARAQARRSEGCLASRVARADHDDVELVLHAMVTADDRRVRRPQNCSALCRVLTTVRRTTSFADTKPRKDMRKHVVARPLPVDLLERNARLLEVGEHELLRQRPAIR